MQLHLKIYQWLLIGAIVVFGVFGGAIDVRADAIFDAMQWNNRILVITGPISDSRYIDQIDILDAAYDGLEIRELIPVHYQGRSVKKIEGLSPFNFIYNRILRTASEQRYLQGRLQVDDDVFAVALVGLDGQVKNVWNDVVTADEIFVTIDAMPIRRRELSGQ